MTPWSDWAETDGLQTSVQLLETALSDERLQPWSRSVVAGLRALEGALTHYVDTVEGAYREIDGTRSTLVRRIERHRRTHHDLLCETRVLLQIVEGRQPERQPSSDELRARLVRLIDAVRHHQTVEDDMVFESVCVDIGAGD